MSIHRYTWKTFSREIIVLGLAVLWCVPFYFLIIGSIRPQSEAYTATASDIPSGIAWSNFQLAWEGNGGFTFAESMKSSIIITLGSVLILVLMGSLAAYAISRQPAKMGTFLYLVFALAIIIPFQLGIIPAYVVMHHLHIAGTYPGMILLHAGLLMPLAVFLYTGFVRTIPRDYEEAAYVDGAGRILTFTKVIFPLLMPITATVALITGVIVWNDFFLQLIFLAGSHRQTVPVFLYGFVGEFAANWTLIFATVVLSILPIMVFYVFAQRQLIRGFSGGIKT